MKFKSLMLSAASIAVLTGVSQAHAGPFYVSVFGGANWLNDNSRFTSTTTFTNNGSHRSGTGFISESARTGFLLGGAVGMELDSWLNGLRVELEASYRHNRVKGFWNTHYTGNGGEGGEGFSTFAQGPLNGVMSTFAVMANVWYDFDIGSKFKPYVGGGVGWARSRLSFAAFETDPDSRATSFAGENDGFAYQVGAGIRYEVMRDVMLGVGYRYFRGPSVTVNFFGPNDFYGGENGGIRIPLKADDENQSVDISLTVGID